MTHPIWYYDCFDYLFARSSAQYDFEVECLSRFNNITSKRVLEIGAGTGEHAARLLRLSPMELVLVDYDSRAVRILEERFQMIPTVNIQCVDGFSIEASGFDLVVCMYSIIQRAVDEEDLIKRLKTLLQFVRLGGICLFEMIDVAKSKEIYPQGELTHLQDISVPLDISVWSEYGEKYFTINFEGYCKGHEIVYQVPLLSLSVESLLFQLQRYQLKQPRIEPLDKWSRRVLIGIRH